MRWDVEYTNEFETWWETLEEFEQEDVISVVTLLEEIGPQLSFPFSSGIERVYGMQYNCGLFQ